VDGDGGGRVWIMNSGCFKKGQKPWNAGVKGIHLSPATEFKKGEMVGSDHYSWKGGEQLNKKDCAYLYDGINKRIRRPKKMYEDANGEVPKGWIIYHLDGDKDNDHLDNLIAIPRVVLLRINSGRMNANYHEIKEAVEQFKKSKDGNI
jgi:hypothetical protein